MNACLKPGSLFLLATLAVCSCGGKNSSTPTAPTPPASRDGNWRGTTSQNLPITFTVSGNSVTAISVNILATYGSSSCNYTTGTSQTATIANNSFSIPIGGGTVSTTLTGSFSSASAANGTVEAFSISGLVCGTTVVIGTPLSQAAKTWTATRQ